MSKITLFDGTEKSFQEIINGLEEPFPNNQISWYIRKGYERKGQPKGIAIPHLQRKDHIDRWDEVLGRFNWTNDIEIVEGISKQKIGIRLKSGDVIFKTDCAANESGDADPGKNGATSSLKRASSLWGVGLRLYGADELHVDLHSSYVDGEDCFGYYIKDLDGFYYFARPDVEDALDLSSKESSPRSSDKPESRSVQTGGHSENKNNSSPNQEFSRDNKITFGEHKGKTFREMDDEGYLEWMAGQSFDDFDQPFSDWAQKELNARGAGGWDKIESLVDNINKLDMQTLAHSLQDQYGISDPDDLSSDEINEIVDVLDGYAEQGFAQFNKDGTVQLKQSSNSGSGSSEAKDKLSEHFG